MKLEGRFVYLGAWASPEARARYNELCDDLLRKGCRDVVTHLTVRQLKLAYLHDCDTYYVTPEGRPTGESKNIRDAVRFLDDWQDEPVSGFGPRKLKAVQDAMIRAGIVRTSINKRVQRIVAMFSWGVSEELLPAATHQAVTTVKGLRRGRSEAAEAAPVLPVPEGDFRGPQSS